MVPPQRPLGPARAPARPVTASAGVVVAPGSQPMRRFIVSNFSQDMATLDDLQLVDALQKKLEFYGPLVGRPCLITRSTDGARIASVQFQEADHARLAMEGAQFLGFEIKAADVAVAAGPPAAAGAHA